MLADDADISDEVFHFILEDIAKYVLSRAADVTRAEDALILRSIAEDVRLKQ